MMGKEVGPKRHEITGNWKKCIVRSFKGITVHQIGPIITVTIKLLRMGWRSI